MFKKSFTLTCATLCLTLTLSGQAAQAQPAQPTVTDNAGASIVIKPLQDNDISKGGDLWQGWGTSLCWWANRIGYHKELTGLSADFFFNKSKGLGLNIMRYNIGGGDDPSHHHITRTDSDVPGWKVLDAATGEFVYDYDADARQLAVMQAAVKAAGQDAIVEVFSNSPPYFMTVSGCSTGNFRSEENNLRDDCYPAFAEYLAHVTDHIVNKLGVKVTSVSPMNEPNTNYWPAFNYKQEGCHFDAGKPQSTILTETRKALDRYGLTDVIVAASDETNPGKQVEEVRLLSAEARKSIGRINTHTYGVNDIVQMGQLARQEDIPLWMSEVDGNGTAGRNAGEMAAGLWLADKIISDINALKPSAWVLWQVIDTHVSKEGFGGRVDKGPLNRAGGYWGLAWADHDEGKVELTQKYYSMGQFTRYIRPGARIITCPTERRSECRVIAAINSDGSKTIVTVNLSEQEKNIELDLSDIRVKRGRTTLVRTSGSIADGEHWATMKGPKVKKGQMQLTLPANSITTILIK